MAKKLIGSLLAIILALSAATFNPVTLEAAMTSALISDGVYRIQQKGSGKYVSSGTAEDIGQPFFMWEKNEQDELKFKLERQKDGTYKITSVFSGLCMDASGTNLGADVVTWNWNDADNQKWYIVDAGAGYYKFVNKRDGQATILDVKDGNIISSVVNGTRVQMWDDNGSDAQRFRLILIELEETTEYPSSLVIDAAVPGSVLTATEVDVGVVLTWTKGKMGDGISRYRIYRYEDNEGLKGQSQEYIFSKMVLIAECDFDVTSFVDVNVQSWREYCYMIFYVPSGRVDGDPEEILMSFESIVRYKETTGEEKGAGFSTDMNPDKKVAVDILTHVVLGAERGGERGYMMMTVGQPTMLMNGKIAEIDPGRGTTPVNKDGRVLMPIRAFIEGIGGSAGWNGDTREVKLESGGTIVIMTLDQRQFLVNTETKELDVPPTIINDRTMLPIRFVAENFGCEVAWVGSKQQVIVVYWL